MTRFGLGWPLNSKTGSFTTPLKTRVVLLVGRDNSEV
jgi:hypothetical protein